MPVTWTSVELDSDVPNAYGEFILHSLLIRLMREAIIDDDYDELKVLIGSFEECTKGVKLKFLNKGIHVAAAFGRDKALQLMLDHPGAKIHYPCDVESLICNENGETPLHLAAEFGNTKCMVALLGYLEDCIDLFSGDKSPILQHNSPLHIAVREFNLNVTGINVDYSCVQTLIEHDKLGLALLNHQNNDGDTVFHIAARWDHTEDSQILESLRLKVQEGKTKARAVHDALNKRNYEGQTPAHIAARYNNKHALEYLVLHDSAWKEGKLSSQYALRSWVVFFILAILFSLLVVAPLLLSENKSTEETLKEAAVWCGETTGTKFNNKDYWKCRCAPFQYYGGVILPPNIFLICSIFFFNMLQWFYERKLLPSLHFISFFSYEVLCMRSTLIEADLSIDEVVEALEAQHAAIDKGEKKEGNKTARLDQLLAACADKGNPQAFESMINGLSMECIKKRIDDAAPSSQQDADTTFTWVYSRFCKSCDPTMRILHQWRRGNYESILHSHPGYHGSSFASQVEYLFLYFQVASSIYSLLTVVNVLRASPEVWQRARTRSSVPDSFLQYNNFYGMLINSDCTNTVFSLLQMAIIERRYSQLVHAWKNLPWGLQYPWLLFVYFPVLILIPPFLTHIIPGFFEFFWVFLPVLFVYYVMRRIRQVMKGDFGSKEIPDIHCYRNKGTPMPKALRELSWPDRLVVYLIKIVGNLIDWGLAKCWNKALKLYFYDFLVDLFSRYAFILIVQIAFDYATLSYLGHNGPEFSELYMRSGGREGNEEPVYGRYLTSVNRVFKWRSQTYCYLQEGLSELHLVMVLEFI